MVTTPLVKFAFTSAVSIFCAQWLWELFRVVGARDGQVCTRLRKSDLSLGGGMLGRLLTLLIAYVLLREVVGECWLCDWVMFAVVGIAVILVARKGIGILVTFVVMESIGVSMLLLTSGERVIEVNLAFLIIAYLPSLFCRFKLERYFE